MMLPLQLVVTPAVDHQLMDLDHQLTPAVDLEAVDHQLIPAVDLDQADLDQADLDQVHLVEHYESVL